MGATSGWGPPPGREQLRADVRERPLEELRLARRPGQGDPRGERPEPERAVVVLVEGEPPRPVAVGDPEQPRHGLVHGGDRAVGGHLQRELLGPDHGLDRVARAEHAGQRHGRRGAHAVLSERRLGLPARPFVGESGASTTRWSFAKTRSCASP